MIAKKERPLLALSLFAGGGGGGGGAAAVADVWFRTMIAGKKGRQTENQSSG